MSDAASWVMNANACRETLEWIDDGWASGESPTSSGIRLPVAQRITQITTRRPSESCEDVGTEAMIASGIIPRAPRVPVFELDEVGEGP